MKFDEVDLIEPIRTALKKIGVSEMTEIQEKAIPILFQKRMRLVFQLSPKLIQSLKRHRH